MPKKTTMKRLSLPILLLAVILFSIGCNKDDMPLLTPAREIVGTWRMAFPVKHYYETDWCDFTTMQLMLTDKRLVTWVITEDTSDPDGNSVKITMNWEESDLEYIQLCMGQTGITPDVRPMFLTGTISGAYLTVKKGTNVFGEFSFTTSNMEGDWDASTCPGFGCQRIYTVNREFKLNLVD